MKNVLFLTIVALGLGACAHHDNAGEHHHHNDQKKASYNGQCAYSVAHNEFNVAGKPEFSYNHGGTVYYFSTAEKLTEFKKNAHKNAELADRMWTGRGAE